MKRLPAQRRPFSFKRTCLSEVARTPGSDGLAVRYRAVGAPPGSGCQTTPAPQISLNFTQLRYEALPAGSDEPRFTSSVEQVRLAQVGSHPHTTANRRLVARIGSRHQLLARYLKSNERFVAE